LQEFQLLLPELANKLLSANRRIAMKLAENPAEVAVKLIRLRELFPGCNVLEMIEKRCG
jgi:hypothetical protein